MKSAFVIGILARRVQIESIEQKSGTIVNEKRKDAILRTVQEAKTIKGTRTGDGESKEKEKLSEKRRTVTTAIRTKSNDMSMMRWKYGKDGTETCEGNQGERKSLYSRDALTLTQKQDGQHLADHVILAATLVEFRSGAIVAIASSIADTRRG